MLQKVVEIATDGAVLGRHYGALRVRSESSLLGEVDLDAISCLILTARNAIISRSLLAELVQRGIPSLVSGSDYMPVGMVVPLNAGNEPAEKIRSQVQLSVPKTKRLWQRIVQAKIEHQALVLESAGVREKARTLRSYARQTRSGDTTNREAVAARAYWTALFGARFRRVPGAGDVRNSALNYGYAIVRSCFARAVCAEGLSPALGINHSNKRNPMCLVDDLMEPYRPVVDRMVYESELSESELTPAIKTRLAQLVVVDFETSNGVSPLYMVAFQVVRSVSRYITGKTGIENIELPWLRSSDELSIHDETGEHKNDISVGIPDYVDDSAL